jgi:hypothetical protein
MDLTIYSYGYSELIYHTLQAIAMFRNSAFYPTVLNAVALASGVILAMRMAASAQEGQWRQYLKQGCGTVIFINMLLLPTTSMSIKDHVDKTFRKVDNIPLAFALPVGMMEDFGHLLAAGFDQVFSLVNSRSANSYYHFGTVFGARLSKEVLEAKVRDPEFTVNMRNFIERCVVLPSMIGQQFTKEELLATKDMWGLVSKKAGTLTRVDMTIDGVRQIPSPNCKQAVPYFEKKFNIAQQDLLTKMANKFRGAGESAQYNSTKRQLNKNLSANIEALYNNEQKVGDILKNNMMINAMNNYRAGKYAGARAQMHAESGGLLSADMAEKTLTGSLTVMKIMIYGSYIFIFPLLVLTGGFKKYGMWILGAFSLQLWPPLFTMLNMVIDFAYEPANIVSYSSWSTEKAKFDSIAATAANMTLIIPFLAIWITKMGEGGFMHLAGSVMATANSAVGAVAGERATGTRAYDNTNINNSSQNMHSSGKIDHNMQYVSGEQSWNNADGSMAKLTAGGSEVITGGQGRTSSSGDATYRMEEAVQGNLTQHYAQSQALTESSGRSLSDSKANTISKAASYLKNIAEHTRTSEGYNIDTSSEAGQAVNHALETVDAITKSNGYSWEQNAESYLNGNLSLSTPLKKVIGIGASGEVGGKVSAGNSSSQGQSDDSSISNTNNATELRNNTLRALTSDSWAQENGMDSSQSSEVRQSYEETQRFEKQHAAHKEEAKNAGDALSYSKTHGTTSGRDMYQDVLETYAKAKGISVSDARRDVEHRTPEVMQVFQRLAGAEANDILNQVRSQRAVNLNPEATEQKLDNVENQYQGKINPDVDKTINNVAANDGFNQGDIKQKITDSEGQNKEQFNNMQQKNNEQYDNIKHVNQGKQSYMKTQVNKYEEDRIGNGDIATLFGLTDGVGKPNNQISSSLYISTPSNNTPKLQDPDPAIVRYTNSAPLPEFEPIVKDYNTGKFVDGQLGSLNNSANSADGQKVSQDITKN